MANESLILNPNSRQVGSMLGYRETESNGVLPIEVSFTRASTGMELLSDGLWRDAAINMPRRYWDGTKYQWLLEPARTKLATYSNDSGNAAWAKTRITVTDTVNTTPFLGVTAKLLTTNANGSVRVKQTLTGLTAGTNYTYQCWVKKGNTDTITTLISDSGEVTASGINYNFATNVFSGSGEGIGYLVSRSSTILSDGWVLITIIIVVPVGQTTLSFNSFMGGTNSTGTLSDTILIANTEIELGANGTSPLITGASTVTRALDRYIGAVPAVTGGTCVIHIPDNLLLRTPGTHVSGPLTLTGSALSLVLGPLAGNNRLMLWTGAAASIWSTTVANLKLAVRWSGTTVDVFQNGVKVVTGYSFAITNVATIQSASGLERPNKIEFIKYYNTVLSDAECIELTT
jgi:hypothetical protein